jgi:hypothetical protein
MTRVEAQGDGTIRLSSGPLHPPTAAHRAAARAYDATQRPFHSWVPVWGGSAFCLHAYPSCSMAADHDDRRTTLCGLDAPFPQTFSTTGRESRCEVCWDATLAPLAHAFASIEAESARALRLRVEQLELTLADGHAITDAERRGYVRAHAAVQAAIFKLRTDEENRSGSDTPRWSALNICCSAVVRLGTPYMPGSRLRAQESKLIEPAAAVDEARRLVRRLEWANEQEHHDAIHELGGLAVTLLRALDEARSARPEGTT